ncbi:cation-transporting P-type ATPase, partial [Lacticaseibacillus paracasei]
FEKTDVVKGQGIIADNLLIGNEKMMVVNHITISPEQKQDITEITDSGASVVLVAADNRLQLIYGIADEIRSGVKESLE